MIRKARYRLGYSQQQVATLIGIQIRQYQRFEYGETEISRIQFKAGLALCAVLELNPALLIFGDDGETLMELKAHRPARPRCKRQRKER